MRVVALPLLGALRLYRLVISPLLPPGTCKYHPSCSRYAAEALRRYGLVRGSLLAAWRLLRCHPWSHGGVDYPTWPPRREANAVTEPSTSSAAGRLGREWR